MVYRSQKYRGRAVYSRGLTMSAANFFCAVPNVPSWYTDAPARRAQSGDVLHRSSCPPGLLTAPAPLVDPMEADFTRGSDCKATLGGHLHVPVGGEPRPIHRDRDRGIVEAPAVVECEGLLLDRGLDAGATRPVADDSA
jgi:hypothetical protein